eukprot:6095791-Amphidinium_carterae.1
MQFREETKKLVRAMYGQKCAFCGKAELANWPKVENPVLIVAHIVDHRPSSGQMLHLQLNSSRNVLLLCYPHTDRTSSCHQQFEEMNLAILPKSGANWSEEPWRVLCSDTSPWHKKETCEETELRCSKNYVTRVLACPTHFEFHNHVKVIYRTPLSYRVAEFVKKTLVTDTSDELLSLKPLLDFCDTMSDMSAQLDSAEAEADAYEKEGVSLREQIQEMSDASQSLPSSTSRVQQASAVAIHADAAEYVPFAAAPAYVPVAPAFGPATSWIRLSCTQDGELWMDSFIGQQHWFAAYTDQSTCWRGCLVSPCLSGIGSLSQPTLRVRASLSTYLACKNSNAAFVHHSMLVTCGSCK